MNLKDFPIKPIKLAELIDLECDNIINSTAGKIIFYELIKNPEKSALQIAEELNLSQSSDVDELENWVRQAITQMSNKAVEYKKGKKGNLNLFMGIVMKLSKGKANPKLTTKILEELLNK